MGRTIRMWSSEGYQLQELHGHTAFIYSVAALPSGELVSCGEDRTVKVWKGRLHPPLESILRAKSAMTYLCTDGGCIQTITLPAISVWSVAVCAESGDIVSGSSDRVVRVFSRESSRWATEEVLKVSSPLLAWAGW